MINETIGEADQSLVLKPSQINEVQHSSGQRSLGQGGVQQRPSLGFKFRRSAEKTPVEKDESFLLLNNLLSSQMKKSPIDGLGAAAGESMTEDRGHGQTPLG